MAEPTLNQSTTTTRILIRAALSAVAFFIFTTTSHAVDFSTAAIVTGVIPGSYEQAVYDSEGNLHIAYHANSLLYYGKKSPGGSWSIQSLGTDASFIALALDPDDRPAIVYTESGAIRMKRYNGSSWVSSNVNFGSLSQISMRFDSAGNLHLAYYEGTTPAIKYSILIGTTWTHTDIDSGDVQYPVSLSIDSHLNPHILYSDPTNDKVKYASHTVTDGWTVSAVAGTTHPNYVDTAFDGFDRLHVLELDNGAFRHLVFDGSSWSNSDTGMGLAYAPSLVIDATGVLHMAAVHAAIGHYDIMYASGTGVNWSTMTIDTQSLFTVSSLAIDGDGIPHWVFEDSGRSQVKEASVTLAVPLALGGNERGRLFAASSMDGTVMGVSSITWSWSDNATNESGYRLTVSTWGSNEYEMVADSTTLAPDSEQLIHTGLSPNTTYQAFVTAVNDGGSVGSNVALKATLANPPTTSTCSIVTQDTINVTWNSNGNPSDTIYQIKGATSAAFTISTTVYASIASATFTYLMPSSTYYFRVRAINRAGTPTAFDSIISTRTLNSPDVTAPAQINNFQQGAWSGTPNEIKFTWTAPGDDGSSGVLPGGSEFRIQYSSDDPHFVSWSPANAQIILAADAIAPGTSVSTSVVINIPRKNIYAKIWTGDENANYSVVSDTLTALAIPFTSTLVHSSIGGVSALAIDSAGDLHALFTASDGLNYMKRTSGVWGAATVIDSRGTTGSIAIDQDDHPHIAYYDGTSQDLNYAVFNGVSWSTTTLDSSGNVGAYQSIAIDAGGRPHIAYSYTSSGITIRYAHYDGTAWSFEDLLDTSADGLGLAFKRNQLPTVWARPNYLQFDGTSWSHVQTFIVSVQSCYALNGFDYGHWTSYPNFAGIGFLQYNNSIATFDTVDPRGGSSSGVGAWSNLLLDGNGNPHVAYLDETLHTPRYGYYTDANSDYFVANSSWTGGYISVNGLNVFQQPGIVLDASGDPQILYRSITDGNIYLASWTGENAPLPINRMQAPSNLTMTRLSNTSFKYDWTDNASNEVGFEMYGSNSSTGPYTLIADSTTLGPNSNTYTETGMTIGTTYYRYVVAYNRGGSAFSKQVSTYVASTVYPSDFAGTALGISSINWTWSDVSNETGYKIESSTIGIVATLPANTTSWIETNLSTNTSYSRRIVAFNALVTSSSPYSSRSTLAMAPSAASPSFVTVNASSMTTAWLPNTNPLSMTTYTVVASSSSNSPSGSANDITISTVPVGASPGALIIGLTGNTSYFVHVRAGNNDGIGTSYTLLGSTCTLPTLPSALSASGVTDSTVTFNWSITGNATDTAYQLQLSSDSFSTVIQTSQTFLGSGSFNGLSPATTFDGRVRAVGRNGHFSNYVTLTSTRTLMLPPAADSPLFTLVGLSSLTVHWTSGGNDSSTLYVVEISSFSSFTTLASSSSTYETSAWFGTGGHGLDLSAGTTYYARVHAEEGSDHSALVVLGSTVTLPPLNTTDVIDSDGGTLNLTTSGGTVSVDIPPSSFSDPVTVIVTMPTTYPAAVSNVASLQGTGLGLEIILDQDVQPSRGVTLVYDYSLSDIQGQGLDERSLVLARFDETSQAWVPMQTAIDTTLHRATAITHHFSLFQLMAPAAAASVDDLSIYPNPLRPARGHTQMTFANAPTGTQIRIYSQLGELIATRVVDGAGLATWDGSNDSGQKVASGLYYAVVDGTGGKKTYRVAVQR